MIELASAGTWGEAQHFDLVVSFFSIWGVIVREPAFWFPFLVWHVQGGESGWLFHLAVFVSSRFWFPAKLSDIWASRSIILSSNKSLVVMD